MKKCENLHYYDTDKYKSCPFCDLERKKSHKVKVVKVKPVKKSVTAETPKAEPVKETPKPAPVKEVPKPEPVKEVPKPAPIA